MPPRRPLAAALRKGRRRAVEPDPNLLDQRGPADDLGRHELIEFCRSPVRRRYHRGVDQGLRISLVGHRGAVCFVDLGDDILRNAGRAEYTEHLLRDETWYAGLGRGGYLRRDR